MIPTKEELENLYHTQGLTQEQIAWEYDVVQATVHYWMKRLQISARPDGARVKGRTCAHYGCKKPHEARDLCKKHYDQWRRGRYTATCF